MDTKKLRQKILDLAIHGKLVPQDPNDEPASVLLQRIREEKERLIKEGKIKRSKKAKTSSDTPPYGNDAPFEVPDSWEWCRLEDIAIVGTGATPLTSISAYYGGNIAWINSSATKEPFICTASNYITELAIKETNCVVYPIGTLVVAMYGEGKTRGQVSELRIDAATNQACAAVRPLALDTKQYIKIFLEANYLHIRTMAEGGAQPNLSLGKISNFLIPLPPLSEQHRIISELERWSTLIDKIERGKADLSDAVRQAKAKILDLAIHGKLLPQNPNDEPATELLRRINPNAVACDKGPYKDLPYGWLICPMGYLADIIGGVSYKKEDITNAGIRILRGGNIQEGRIETYDDDVYISSQYQSQENAVQANDILLVASTGSSILIGKTGFANKSLPNTQIGAFLRIIRMKTPSIAKYVNCVFLSDYYKNYIRGIAKGSNINNIKNNYITDFQITLPPLAEQQRIVSRVEELFARLDSIERSLE